MSYFENITSGGDVAAFVEKSGRPVRRLGTAMGGAAIQAVRLGGDRKPGILIKGGSHATEIAGIHAALTLIEEGPKTLANPGDYDARANLMWCATQALNGVIGCGVPQDWATHMIGHELTALYGIDHAQSLAVVMPSLLSHQKERKRDKLLRFARRVWNLQGDDQEKLIDGGIDPGCHRAGSKLPGPADHYPRHKTQLVANCGDAGSRAGYTGRFAVPITYHLSRLLDKRQAVACCALQRNCETSSFSNATVKKVRISLLKISA